MLHQVAEALVRNNVLLAANLTKAAMHHGSAVQAVFFFPFRLVRQVKFFLKISTIHSITEASSFLHHPLCLHLAQTISFMKTLLLPFLLLLCSVSNGQYYYKDIIGTKGSSELIRTYKNNNVTRVIVNSYDATDTKNDNFFVEQQYEPIERILRTTTRSEATNESVLISYSDAEGRVTRTIDSSEGLTSTTTYEYDVSGRLLNVLSTTTDSAKTLNETE